MPKKIAIIKANFNSDITDAMLKECQKLLRTNNVKHDVYQVAGSFEIPYMIKTIINKYDGFIAIGCLIKGDTMHFEYISSAVSYGLMKISIEQKKPIGFSVLTCLNKAQAKKRIPKVRDSVLALLNLLSNKR
jgi:6,7-dimethyl-8-ribityllumazine synthase